MTPVEQIKEKLSIVDVVSSYVKLEKAGLYFKARCPFHNEKTPSFFVSPQRGSYHCFGCGRGGDIFSFVQEIEGAEFKEALKTLAERAGVKLQSFSKENRPDDTLYRVMEEAASFYEKNLSQSARDYLKARGLTDETIKEFRLGYTRSGWSVLYDHLKSAGFDDTAIERAGLASRGKSGFFDRFRDRIMFPITDASGRVIAFTGRTFSPDGKAPEDAAKYVNSPETPLYNKSQVLYGYDKAKRDIMKENFCVVVEGQMDLIMAHQAGTKNSVAVSGTALSEQHLRLIKRFTDRIAFSFDSDSAGVSASKRGIDIALSQGFDVSAISVPESKDPADCIKENPELWHNAVQARVHIITFLLSAFRSVHQEESAFRRAVEKEIIPYLSYIASPIERGHFIHEISSALGISEKHVEEALGKYDKTKGAPPALGAQTETPPDSKAQTPRRRAEMNALGFILWQTEKDKGLESAAAIRREFEHIAGATPEAFAKNNFNEKEIEDAIFQAEILYANTESLQESISKELLLALEQSNLEERFQKLLSELKRAEQDKDQVRAIDIVGECQKISRRLEEIKSSRHRNL